MRRYDERDKRSINLLHDSLAHNLGAWSRPIISIWQASDHENENELPDLVFVTQYDVEIFREASSEEFNDVDTIVICPDIGKYSESDSEKIKAASVIADAIITGSVVPSKLWKTLTLLFPHIVLTKANAVARSLEDLSIQDWDDEQHNDAQASNSSDEQHLPAQEQTKSHDGIVSGSEDVHSPHAEEIPQESHTRGIKANENPATQPSVSPEASVETHTPRLLLVDDNAVNLKVLFMFLKKSGILMFHQTCASGGEEALDAFEETLENGNPFDIVFMDLSKPVISDFQATATIRYMEDIFVGMESYIVALTGLVSDKDRAAAKTAGVDDYVTKPAGLKNVQNVIKTWETQRKAWNARSRSL
jgi:CheY-like chemotaxis protein